jgi:hypothetical protein
MTLCRVDASLHKGSGKAFLHAFQVLAAYAVVVEVWYAVARLFDSSGKQVAQEHRLFG